MPKRFNDVAKAALALENSSWAAGAVVGEKINGTGFGRARFIFTVGANGGTSGALSSGLGPWQAATSGATFTAISAASCALAAVTSGVLSKLVMVIDTVIDGAKPWLMLSGGSVLSTAIQMSAIVELYQGVKNPPTDGAQQVVKFG